MLVAPLQLTLRRVVAVAAACAVGMSLARFAGAAPIGLFEGPTDVGAVSRPTLASYDRSAGAYTISASGDNMWAQRDAFGFVWQPVTGDVVLAADITFVGASAQGHRKACLMFRQTLAHDSAYADVAVHGDGLTSLQFRSEAGGLTREVQCPVSAPRRVQLERRGDYVVLQIATAEGDLALSGCTVRLPFEGTFYAGLAVCAHDNAAFETAVFTRVELNSGPRIVARAARTSAIEIIPLSSLDRRVVYRTTDPISGAHFTRENDALIFTRDGGLFRLPLQGSESPSAVSIGDAKPCTAYHGFSPDGSRLAVTHLDSNGGSLVSLVDPRDDTIASLRVGPSTWWQSWSPEGATLALGSERDGQREVFIYSVEDGTERRLTDSPGIDDGADFSADGRWIYFHSERSGRMQLWRMRPDGGGLQQLTHDETHSWFPHPSPDGQHVVFLASSTVPQAGLPAEGDYFLRLMPAAGGASREIARFFGGPGTLPIPCWSSDSTRIAYITLEPR